MASSIRYPAATNSPDACSKEMDVMVDVCSIGEHDDRDSSSPSAMFGSANDQDSSTAEVCDLSQLQRQLVWIRLCLFQHVFRIEKIGCNYAWTMS